MSLIEDNSAISPIEDIAMIVDKVLAVVARHGLLVGHRLLRHPHPAARCSHARPIWSE